ncbi:unnamed protein product [Malus baccata var. baccata]
MLSRNLLSVNLPYLRGFLSAPASFLGTGDTLKQARVFTNEDVIEFSKVRRDYNHLHLNSESARNAGFEDRLVHRILVTSPVPNIISSHFGYAKRMLSGCSKPDFEDSGGLKSAQKKTQVAESFLHRYRKKGLLVTDITGSEWCEKQMEFVLLVGKRKESMAMKAGIARHAKLEEEVVKKAKVRVKLIEDKWDPKSRLSVWSEPNIEDAGGLKSAQNMTRVADSLHLCRKKGLSVTYFSIIDIETTQWYDRNMELVFLVGMQEVSKAMEACIARHVKLEEEAVKRVKDRVKSIEVVWALKLLKFITGVDQLLFEGMTRELPLIGFIEGVWMVGVIDEIRLSVTETNRNPILVDTKTRVKDTLPHESQQRNGRVQLMCYKCIWDTLAANKFPSEKFYDFFSLKPHYILPKTIRARTVKSGFPAVTLDDIVRHYGNMCSNLRPAHDQLLLRYELQRDHSLLGEDEFAYDSDWIKSQIQCRLEFLRGEREARCTPKEERWKCLSCQHSNDCQDKKADYNSPPS